jgi:hypothetical protein
MVTARSKRWWGPKIKVTRQHYCHMCRQRQEGTATADQEKVAQNAYNYLQRHQQCCCWVTFLENANGDKVWDVLHCTTTHNASTMGVITNKQGQHAEDDQDKCRMMAEVSFPPPNPYEGLQSQPGPPSKAYTMVMESMVYATLFQQSNKKALGRDSIGVPVIKALLQCDRQRVTSLVSQCLCLGYHPEEWKVAKGVCIQKPGKKSYDQAKSYRVISLLSCLGKLIEKVVATLITNEVERCGILHVGQFGAQRGRSAVDAESVLAAAVEDAWEQKKITATLMMDVKGAFPTVNRSCLLHKMHQAKMDDINRG